MPLFSVARIRSAGLYCEVPADEKKRNDSLEGQGQKCGSRDSSHAKK